MNTKEVGEIRRCIRRDRSNMTAIYGCYVNSQKEIISEFKQSTLTMPENEAEKYFASDSERCSSSTKYAEALGGTNHSDTGYNDWWLRTIGAESGFATHISYDGHISGNGAISGFDLGVRPAMWIEGIAPADHSQIFFDRLNNRSSFKFQFSQCKLNHIWKIYCNFILFKLLFCLRDNQRQNGCENAD